MAVTLTEAVEDGTVTAERTIAVRPAVPVRIMALSLWGIVGGLLSYGIVMTAIKAASLFS
ncbi:hypothetical protein [Cellulomonas sp. KRMCY2]|uniref:hypothetical protein n=1 Tax=Cellulomonas sp. KRMCY2 TaxID=1304865 RepID=UPI00045E7AE8|nr:hypothetical protein [Cellulomonas sp. KRMCY2]